MTNRTNTVLAVLLVIVVAMTALVRVDLSKPNIEILPDMKYTPAWEAFAANPNFPDGRTMQAPVAGTIARGTMPLYYAATKEDAVRAGEELENPSSLSAIEAAVAAEHEVAEATAEAPDEASRSAEPSGTGEVALQTKEKEIARAAVVRERFSASIERGSDVYHTFCISCHGPKGAGDGPVTQRGFPPPPSMLTGKSLQMKDGQLFHILTYGQGTMAPFPAQLTRERRWDVINYVRDLQSKAGTSATAQPDDPAAAAAASSDGAEAPAEEKEEATDQETAAKTKNGTPKLPRNALRRPPGGNSKSPESYDDSKLPESN